MRERRVAESGGPDHFGEPPEMGRTPIGPAGVAALMSQQERLEAKFGVFASAEGICTGPAEVANGFIFKAGDIDGGEIPRACQPGPWPGVPAVGVDPIPGLCGHERGRHHPAVGAFVAQIAGASVATRAGFIDKDQRVGLGVHLTDELSEITLAGADGAKIGDLSAMILSDRRHGKRVLVDVHSEEERGRLGHG
jgi:hypothetical protein